MTGIAASHREPYTTTTASSARTARPTIEGSTTRATTPAARITPDRSLSGLSCPRAKAEKLTVETAELTALTGDVTVRCATV